MTQTSRVPAPRSPLDGRWGAAGIGLAVVLAALVVKPWSPASADPPAATSRPSPDAPVAVAPEALEWDPASLGTDVPDPAWELWAAGRVTRIRFVGPADGFSAAPSVRPDETAVIGGPVIDLGDPVSLTAFAVNRPAGTQLGAVRLWRFVTGGPPERVDLVELEDPWGAEHVRVFGVRADGLPSGKLSPWAPGLYRLDLLIEPVDRIRTLLLNVAGRSPETARRGGEAMTLDPRLLRRLPPAAERWAFGRFLVGWKAGAGDGPADCRVAEIWAAREPDDPCHPTPVGSVSVVGLNLGGEAIVRLDLRQVDPLPGQAAATVSVRVNGRPGLAMASSADGPFADGIYRLEARTASGREIRWYVETGPDLFK